LLADYKQNFGTLISKYLSVVLFISAMIVLLPMIFHFAVTLKPHVELAVDGNLELTSSDISEKRMLGLSGDWLFFENQFVAPNDVSNAVPQLINISSTVGWQLSHGGTDTVTGYGTYHLNVDLGPRNSDLALKIPQIETAYRLFVNDSLMASAGVISKSSKGASPEYKPTIIMLPRELERFSITVQVSNYHSAWGGIWSPIVLGEVGELYAAKRDLVGLSMFVIGALVVTTGFYLIQFYFRPSEKVPLAFACLCLIFLFREFTAEHMYFVMNSLGVGFHTLVKLNYLTFYIGFPVVVCFMHLCFPRAFNQKISRFFYLVAAVFSLFVLFSPMAYVGYSLLSYQVFCLLGILYITICMIVATKNKQPASKMTLFGCIILGLFAVNDMLYAIDFVATGRFFSLGIVGFILCQSYVINNRFNNIMSHNETLSGQLQQRNSELQKLGDELETKVEKRTQQLELANLELNNLANIDNLTGALNRHGLQQHLQSAFERSRRNQEPSSIILFDFDNFKQINDSYGHDNGDNILKLGAKLIQDLIREQDKLARWGGEEFLVFLPNTDLQGASAIGDKLRKAIANQLAGELADDFPVTVTGGVAQIKNDETFEILFKRADNALYKGKRMGRNCIQS
jgi:diguanylate cyclase (GGDEF)-like protein